VLNAGLNILIIVGIGIVGIINALIKIENKINYKIIRYIIIRGADFVYFVKN